MDLTKGKVSTALLKFTMPIILMQILNQAYMVADSVIVARFVNETALSIWLSANNILLIGYAILSGFSGAGHIVVGRFYGEQQYDKIKPTVFTLGMAGMALGLVQTVIYLLFSCISERISDPRHSNDCPELRALDRNDGASGHRKPRRY